MDNYVWYEKVWGRTKCTCDFPHFASYELEVIENTYCSFHYHLERTNRFIVWSGVVRVVWTYGWQTHWKTLQQDEELTIKSRVPHQFQVIESGKMIEHYFSDRGKGIMNSDIVRLTTGGKLEGQTFADFGQTRNIMVEGNVGWSTPPF